MAFKRLRAAQKTEIPTSSMADIAFLLIIFFMLTAVFTSSRGLEFAFPKDDPNDTNVQPERAIHIKIVGEGQFLVDKTPMSIEEMGGYIQTKMDQNPEKPVIIQTLPDVPYYVMVDVFDLLKYLEVKNVSIPTRTEIERWKRFGVF
ncbi:MAG: ExbD/TolR family protein [Acidobacteriota bacterium]